ncbi:hypothetical protein Cni_G02488 [Canna indica]|uniref:Uncharacterized protein n=1 Tax=Canna indica TaxID=4628 RepID=A0AAQ3Q2S5_9LILI|nr:hypothetical protein Cni_G02488 [Canna indica]
MEIKIQRRAEYPTGNGAAPKQSMSRLQKRAPASLQLEATPKSADTAWGNDAAAARGAASDPIPLLSPLVLSPSAPLWKVESSDDSGGNEDAAGTETPSPASPPNGWHHPALQMATMEPASLVPFFEFQCSVVDTAS